MKRFSILVLVFTLVALMLASCGLGGHEHTFSTDWSKDETNHWITCTDEACADVKVATAAHKDVNNDKLCDVCGYDYSHTHTYQAADAWTFDATNHWHAATCGCSIAVKDSAAHVDANNDSKCDVCGYDGHAHTYADAWTKDASGHWHAATCGCENEKVVVTAHTDANEDAVCDVCGYEITYTVTVTAEDNVTLGKESIVVNNGATATFTASVDADFVLIADNATAVGEAVVADGVATYTFEVAAVAKDTAVSVNSVCVNYSFEVATGEGTIENLVQYNNTAEVTVNIPAAGTYIITAAGYMDANTISLDVNGGFSPCQVEIEEAGEYTFTIAYFAWDTPAAGDVIDYEYTVIGLNSTDIELAENEGDGYTVPTGISMNAVYTAAEEGWYLFTSSDELALGEYERVYYVGYANAGATIEFSLKNNDTTTADFDLDWKVEKVGEATAMAVGDNTVAIPLEKYVAISFTAPVAGAYVITLPETSETAISYDYYSEYYDRHNMNTTYTPIELNLAAGETVVYYLCNFDATEAYDETVTVTFGGSSVVENEATEDNDNDYVVNTSATGALMIFEAQSEAYYTFTAPAGVLLSFDNGETWVSSYEAKLYYDTVRFLVKNSDATSDATTAVIEIAESTYKFDFNQGANEIEIEAGKEYAFTMNGLSGFYASYILTWNNADVTVTIDGQEYVSGSTGANYSKWSSTAIFTLADGAASNEVTFVLIDPAKTEVELGDNSFDAEGEAYFFATDAGYYVFNVVSGTVSTNGAEADAGEFFELYLEAGEYVGLTLEGEGTIAFAISYAGAEKSEEKIYNVNVGANDKTYVVSFTAPEKGSYTISTADGELNAIVAIMTWESNGAYQADYTILSVGDPVIMGAGSHKVKLAEGETVYFLVATASGAADEINLVVAPAADDIEITVEETNVTVPSYNTGDVYTFTAPFTGEFTFTVDDLTNIEAVFAGEGGYSSPMVELPLTIALTEGQDLVFAFMAPGATADFDINVKVTAIVEVGSVIGYDDVTPTENTVTLPANTTGLGFSFVAPEAGKYRFDFDINGEFKVVAGEGPFVDLPIILDLEAGEEIDFVMANNTQEVLTGTATVEKAVYAEAVAAWEYSVEVVVVNYYPEATPVTFTAEEAGTYVLTIDEEETNASIFDYNNFVDVSERTYEFTLDAGETITFMVATTNYMLTEDTIEFSIAKQ